jgi:transcriptional regulator with XRE-family HTH domain
MTLEEILGNNVRGFRKRLAMTQSALAGKANIDTTWLGHVERGSANVKLAMLGKLASALKVDPSVLLIKGAYLDAEKYQKAK